MNNTYKINYYSYPFTIVINITNINSIYFITFGLINNEKVNKFIQLINIFDELRYKVRVIKLKIIIINFDN